MSFAIGRDQQSLAEMVFNTLPVAPFNAAARNPSSRARLAVRLRSLWRPAMSDLTPISSLVPVAARDFSGEPIQTISARDLHAFLESKQDFSTWIKRRIEQYAFAESVDYVIISGPQENGALETEAYAQGRIEYFMTLDMAKELAMVERNDKGREARHYFIDCERQLKTSAPQLPQDYLSALKALVESEETKQLALAQARALAQQIETDRPYTELARAITGQSTMTRRDWCALMKTDHGYRSASAS